jgi:hypothetical protein
MIPSPDESTAKRTMIIEFLPMTRPELWSRPGAGFICVEPWQVLAASIDFTASSRAKRAWSLSHRVQPQNIRCGCSSRAEKSLHRSLRSGRCGSSGSTTRKNLRPTRAGAQKFCQLGLRIAEFIYSVPEYVDRIEGSRSRSAIALPRRFRRAREAHQACHPPALRCATKGLDRCERGAVILVCAKGPDVQFRLLRTATIIFRVGTDELHERDLPTQIEGGHQAIVTSRHLKPHTLAV